MIPINYLRIEQFCHLSGWSESWVRKQIQNNRWQQNREYVRVYGRILIDLAGYHAWVAQFKQNDNLLNTPQIDTPPLSDDDDGDNKTPPPLC